MNSSNKINNSKINSNVNSKVNIKLNNKKDGMGKIIFFVVLIIFILFLLYVISVAVYSSQKEQVNSPVIINDVIDAYIARPAFDLPKITDGMNQTFSTWIYVKDWNYKFGQYKNILWKGTNKSSSTTSTPEISNIHCPSIWLYPLTNSLKVVTSTSAPEQVESCDISNIPLMTWVHIVYVLNNRTVDIFINGKLERSCALRGIPIISDSPVYITTGKPQAGFYGKIGKTQYFTRALLPNDVANIYQQGPLGTAQFQVNFFRNGKFIDFSSSSMIANDSVKK
jgi:hypothetical protein